MSKLFKTYGFYCLNQTHPAQALWAPDSMLALNSHSVNTCWINKHSWPLNRMFELHWSTYTWIYFSITMYYSTTLFVVIESTESRIWTYIWKADDKLYTNIQLLGAPNPLRVQESAAQVDSTVFVYTSGTQTFVRICMLDIWSRSRSGSENSRSSAQSTYLWTKVKNSHSN